MGGQQYQSWGRYPKAQADAVRLEWRSGGFPVAPSDHRSSLPYGNGRSYGDSCLNDGGVVIDCRGLDRFIEFDTEQGILRCEAGVLLSEILALIVPTGWFLPVTPGTQFITVGGAIANDVHGKNHHRAGTFGCHVQYFELLRSDGSRLLCSPDGNGDWFGATVGGLGLTGIITWAEIRLQRIANPYIDHETIRYGDLDEFFAISAESDGDFDYTVAWVDCLAKGGSLGRGLFMRGNHVQRLEGKPPKAPAGHIRVPFDPPLPLVNGATLKLFNALYYRKQLHRIHRGVVHYAPFFYPLDSVLEWNRIYGGRGFLQYQCAVPSDSAQDAITEILRQIAAAGTGSFLAVLKMFGDVVSPGLLSFPRPGATLALDFPNRGEATFDLLDRLDRVTLEAGGLLYPAKDARMSPATFRAGYSRWEELLPFIDPRFSSGFWRRVTTERA